MKEKKLLDQINYPSDLRKLEKKNLKQLADELRKELVDVVSEGGFIGKGERVKVITVNGHRIVVQSLIESQ